MGHYGRPNLALAGVLVRRGAGDLSLQSLWGCSVRDNGGPLKELRGNSYFLTNFIRIRGFVWGEEFLFEGYTPQLASCVGPAISIKVIVWTLLEGLTDVEGSLPHGGSLHSQEEDLEGFILPTLPCICMQTIWSFLLFPPIIQLSFHCLR